MVNLLAVGGENVDLADKGAKVASFAGDEKRRFSRFLSTWSCLPSILLTGDLISRCRYDPVWIERDVRHCWFKGVWKITSSKTLRGLGGPQSLTSRVRRPNGKSDIF